VLGYFYFLLNLYIFLYQELATQKFIANHYIVENVNEKYHFSTELQTSEITIHNQHIKIIENKTGRLAPLSAWELEEEVPPGEIVETQLEINGEKVSVPTEVWLSNRERGDRYFSWLNFLTVKDRNTGVNHTAVIQRISTDDAPMDKRQWRIIHIYEDGKWAEENFSYNNRSQYPLGIKLVTQSGTQLMEMGYHTDPSPYYGLIFPVLTLR